MKKIVIFGGGSGLSQILKGLKLFPVEITAVVSVSDNGTSTGKLREDFSIPAVGDISKVIVAMSNTTKDMEELLSYRFKNSQSLGNHSIKNLLLTALLDIKGDFAHAIPVLCQLLDINGTVLPTTEENVNLVGFTEDGKKIVGEVEITHAKEKIIDLEYDKEISTNESVLKAVYDADLIVFSSGSLLTSLFPHLILKDLCEAVNKSKAKKLYVCNLVTQPGETDDFQAIDHLKMIEKYLGYNSVNAIIVNNCPIKRELALKYSNEEQKDPVIYDEDNFKDRDITVLADKIYTIENSVLRHDSLKTAYLIFSYLMDEVV